MEDNNIYDEVEIVVYTDEPTSPEGEGDEEYQPDTPNQSYDESAEKKSNTELINKSKVSKPKFIEYVPIPLMTPPTSDVDLIKMKIQRVANELPFTAIQALLSFNFGFPKAENIVEKWLEENLDELDDKEMYKEKYDSHISKDGTYVLPKVPPRKEYLTSNKRSVWNFIKEPKSIN